MAEPAETAREANRRAGGDLEFVGALGGGDVELGNFIVGPALPGDSGTSAALAVLAEIDGVGSGGFAGRRDDDSEDHDAGGSGDRWDDAAVEGRRRFDPRDWARKFLPSNGGCVYIDLGHVEVCLPEVTRARDFVAYWHAMLGIVAEAREAADRGLAPGRRLCVTANNGDGCGGSWGAHVNLLLPREAFERILHRKGHLMLYLASYQASSLVLTGQGKVGSDNGRPDVPYQISQRTDFLETLSGYTTTCRRALVNLRDEPHCGHVDPRAAPADQNRWARLHVIACDANLCHVACYLKFGVLRIVLSMIAAERIDPGLILEDPLEAAACWSRDPGLSARAATLGGDRLTAVEHERRVLEEARRFVVSGECPLEEAGEILATWDETLHLLERRDWSALRRRLDWVLKLWSLEQAMAARPRLSWKSPEVRCLDLLYGSLDPAEGLYWSYQRDGLLEPVADDAAIDLAMCEPPEATRAWTRAMLLRRAAPGSVARVSWDSITFHDRGRGGTATRTLAMPDPLSLGRAQAGPAFRAGADLQEILDALGVP